MAIIPVQSAERNRNALRTQRLLREAYAAMVKRGAHVTVASLCREADINRSTFYGHYVDLTDFRASFEEGLMEELVCKTRQILEARTSHEAYGIVMELGRYYEENVALYLAVSGSNPGRNAMVLRDEVMAGDGNPSLDDAMRADLVLSSVASIFHGWAVGFYGDTPVSEVSKRMAAFVIGALGLTN